MGCMRGSAGDMMSAVPEQRVPWLTEKAPTSLVGAAGEHYCMMQRLPGGPYSSGRSRRRHPGA